ncbi:ribonuclease E inhibitor RraB [Priestia taiwanensis]|uniref:Regulator of ribonuclease activity B domain-containing protein n=1 Tax=Priestia taiwanensis TaxID=1347902 RepID=A0A917ATE3_9BACI|nr:ribonuclease E inhibitor RraB [Priestia taiwanensis]MBM7364099.1 regulator of RNase E activity RraB [Priestia taiwanensis]GGE71591.1 hypothetical protein GCM10007140_21920 [Priestia taiwanensis]
MRFPNDEDGHVLHTLYKEGLDFSQEHVVDFFVVVPNQQSGEALLPLIMGAGFDCELQYSDEYEDWTCYCSKKMFVRYEKIIAIQQQLNELGEKVGGHIDGWATLVDNSVGGNEKMAELLEERQRREQEDIETIEALAEAGSNMKKEHYLEHYFVLDTIDMAENIADDLQMEGYDVYEPMEHTEGGSVVYIFAVGKSCMPTKEAVSAETKRMAELAITHFGSTDYYDGWEAEVVKKRFFFF